MTRRRTIGVALGSGSARGWAHVGVLRALAEQGIAPDYLAGCADIIIAVDLGSDMVGRFAREEAGVPAAQNARRPLISALLSRQCDVAMTSQQRDTPPQPSMLAALLGAIDIMQERIAQGRLAAEPPDVLLTPRLGQLGALEYHRAALAIAEGREAVTRMQTAIRHAVGF